MQRGNIAQRVAACLMAPALAALVLAGCNDKGTAPAGPSYAVGGIVSGDNIGALKLTNNGGDELTLNAAGQFSFPGRLPEGASYDVRISQQPTAPAQTCTVSANTGMVSGADVVDVYVECSALSLAVLDIINTGPGQAPSLTFKVLLRGAPVNIIASPLQALRATIAGPTSDYAVATTATVQGTGATGMIEAVDAAQGIFRYTFASPIALDATGSYAVGLEGYAMEGGARLSGVSPVAPFAVTDAEAVARRTIVEDARCNSCHVALTAHGNQRGVQYCATCHNPNKVDLGNIARVEGQSITVPSLDMKVMIHKIHRGSALDRKPYLLWPFPGPTELNPMATPTDYSALVFPGDLGACESCHRPGTYDVQLSPQRLPTREFEYVCNENLSDDFDSLCALPDFVASTSKLVPPVTASCLSCHDAPHTEAHASTMTTSTGAESCATCHASGSALGIDKYHSLSVRPR